MSTEEKIALLEDLMELDEGELDLNADLADIEEWDSLTKLSLMATIKKMYNKSITVEKLKSFKKVKDICDYLQ